MGTNTKSPNSKDPKDTSKKNKQPAVTTSSPSYSSPPPPSYSHSSSTTTFQSPNNASTQSTEIPVRQPPAPVVTPPSKPDNNGDNQGQSTYQAPAPGFDHIVRNVPGVGLVYQQNPGSVHGFNPASSQQPQLHQIPGVALPQVLPPGFIQQPAQVAVPRFVPVSNQTNPAMSYTSYMPNQGQHFQPPVPDTTFGPIPHTYHPRSDNNATAMQPGQYVTMDGQLYQVVGTAPSGSQVQYVPIQQPAPGIATAPIVIQGTQQPVIIQGQPAIAVTAAAAPVTAQPGAIPAMVSQPPVQIVGGAAVPGALGLSSAPDVMGIGKTATEVQIEQYHTALNTKALEGQDIAPADPDPSRMYYCRELDGEWTLRNRYGIDNMGDCRWYVMPGGIFYAVRLAD